MENKDLGAKKVNNQQQINEGFSGENLPDGYNPSKANTLKNEVETDAKGRDETVERARNVDSDNESNTRNKNGSDSADDKMPHNQKTVENKDRNSDIAKNRYPSSHPDNHIDRGNMKLDEE